MGRRRTMEWAAKANHMGGIPRKVAIMAAGAFAKAVANVLNSTTVHNGETLIRLVRSRPSGVPLITVSNHMSTLDDPLMWGFKGFPTTDAKLARWVLAAEDICFKNRVLSYFFRLGKCIPITRGAGIYQENMNEALERLSDGAWLHTFPEGKVSQESGPIRRLKWGTASLIARAPVTPIVLPIVHHGFHEVSTLLWNWQVLTREMLLDAAFIQVAWGEAGFGFLRPSHVMPEKYLFGRRPPLPLCNKKIQIIVGEPVEFDLPKLRGIAVSMSKDFSSNSGWPTSSTGLGLNEAAQKCLYSSISNQIWMVMENLRSFGKTFLKSNS